jgi:hypothetical protein
MLPVHLSALKNDETVSVLVAGSPTKQKTPTQFPMSRRSSELENQVGVFDFSLTYSKASQSINGLQFQPTEIIISHGPAYSQETKSQSSIPCFLVNERDFFVSPTRKL